jgi:hypothetical protein
MNSRSTEFIGSIHHSRETVIPFRFETIPHLQSQLEQTGFRVGDAELLSRTYGNRRETFQFISLEAVSV